jgi:hypothetical protein
VDPTFEGYRCSRDADCVSGDCDSGLCRCATSADCCSLADATACDDAGYRCAPSVDAIGDICRASHPVGRTSIAVYEDRNDAWVRARPIWNQHAYAVTHVADDGVVPAPGSWVDNWTQPGLNNFRQQASGTPLANGTGDAVAGPSTSVACGPGGATLSAPVCNRGADPIAAGLGVVFYDGATVVCSTATSATLLPGACEEVSCTWATPPVPGEEVDVAVIPNDLGAYRECRTNNNAGTVFGVSCPP